MTHESGVIDLTANDQVLKSWMLRKLRLLGEATAGTWEQAVFQGLTGMTRHDVDWSDQVTHQGYSYWIALFGKLVGELVAEGAVVRDMRNGRTVLFPTPHREGSFDLH